MEHVVRAADVRTSETPNAVMTTLASPSLGGSESLAVWRVEMRQGQKGPAHSFDREQIWTVLTGAATVTLAGGVVALNPGDTIVLPPNTERQLTPGEAFHA